MGRFWSLDWSNLRKLFREAPSLKVFGVICIVFFLASLSSGPRKPHELRDVAHVRIGSLVISRPLVLSGDAPHYLVGVNSLLEDGDFDLSNNYEQALQGDWDLGARFRGVDIDHHTDPDRLGREFGTHSPFFSLLLAALLAPVGPGPWVGSLAIWLTLASALTGVWITGKWIEQKLPGSRNSAVITLSLATPLLCYARDIWTEPWVLMLWACMLLSRSNCSQALSGFLATLLKYPFVVVPFTMSIIAFCRKDYRKGTWLLGASVTSVLTAVLTAQWLFREVGHFSLFHSGIHYGFDLPFDGAVGLLLDPRNGLLFFFPVLALGLMIRKSDWVVFAPAVAFFLVHASYGDWGGGTGFSARYLVPVLPFLILLLLRGQSWGWPVRVLWSYSAFWSLFGGFFPAIVYDRSPWEVLIHVWSKLMV